MSIFNHRLRLLSSPMFRHFRFRRISYCLVILGVMALLIIYLHSRYINWVKHSIYLHSSVNVLQFTRIIYCTFCILTALAKIFILYSVSTVQHCTVFSEITNISSAIRIRDFWLRAKCTTRSTTTRLPSLWMEQIRLPCHLESTVAEI